MIDSNARHAVVEVEGVLSVLEDPDRIWNAIIAASSRLGYIGELLREAGHEPPRR